MAFPLPPKLTTLKAENPLVEKFSFIRQKLFLAQAILHPGVILGPFS